VFENRVLRRIFGPRDEVREECKKLHYEELNDLYCSLNIVRVVKSRRMRWAGHVARMRDGRRVYRDLVGQPEAKRPLGRLRLILRWIFREWDVGVWTGSSWLKIGTGGVHL
jgi:hypothetical protein